MAIERVPLDDGPNWEQRTVLDGRDYILRFLYNSRTCRWTMSIFDQNNDPIAQGVSVVVGCDLLSSIADQRKPPGKLYAVDLPASGETETERRDPHTVRDFGERVGLYYMDEQTSTILDRL